MPGNVSDPRWLKNSTNLRREELTLSCRNVYALRDRPEILAIARNNPSDDEEANSPREGYNCFDDSWLKEPATVALERRPCTCICRHRVIAA